MSAPVLVEDEAPLAAPDRQTETLTVLIDRAATALASARTSGEVLEARDLAGVAYDAAKSAARLARAKKAHDSVIAEIHRAQAAALSARARAEIRLAEEYDAAQERGEVARQGGDKVSNVAKSNVAPTAADLGLRRDEVHEARRLRDAEAADPGVIERTVSDMVERGDEPTRAALRREVAEAAKLGNAPPRRASRKNPLYRPDPERDAVIQFAGSCRAVAKTENLEALASFDGFEGFRIQMLSEARAALDTLTRFMKLVEEHDAQK